VGYAPKLVYLELHLIELARVLPMLLLLSRVNLHSMIGVPLLIKKNTKHGWPGFYHNWPIDD
jgi:uncharacterized membrane protein